ncbi:Uma2 family endonuclease [Streptosporangium soli]|nr:Uma2 family endonuclease [Streptosporangium sp. KLBMP 9127]
MESEDDMSAQPEAPPLPPPVSLFPNISGPYTIEDWLAFPETRERVEFIDGSFWVSTAPALAHAICAHRLAALLLASAPPDMEVVEAANMRVGDEGFIPDIVVGWSDVMLSDAAVLDVGDVVMTVEIVSPSNRKRDYIIKPASYAAAGVPVFMRVELHGDGVMPYVEVFAAKEGRPMPIASARAGQILSLTEPYEISFDPAALVGPRQTTG